MAPPYYLADTPTADPIMVLEDCRVDSCRQLINQVDDKREVERRKREREAKEKAQNRERWMGQKDESKARPSSTQAASPTGKSNAQRKSSKSGSEEANLEANSYFPDDSDSEKHKK